MAKMLAADASWEAAKACLQTHGGFGFAEEYDVERKFRETRLYPGRADLDQPDPVLPRRARARHAAVVLSLPMLPLEGIIVVAIEQAVAAPFCSARLADAGARVIKIERPEGDFARGYDDDVAGQSSYFVWLNRGKEFARARPRITNGRKTLRSLIAGADVLLQNLKPGALERSASRRACAGLPEADHLLDQRLRRQRAARRPQGLRPADPGRESGLCLDHRRPGRASASRHIDRRYRHRRHSLFGDPRGADRPPAPARAPISVSRCST